MIGLDSISLNLPGLIADGELDGVRCWHTESGEPINCHYFPVAPDLTAPPEDIQTLRSQYRSALKNSNMALISVDTAEVGECAAVKTIFKGRIPKQQHGIRYIASLTIPFRDFSFTLRTGGEEAGITGYREAIIVDLMLKEGKISTGPSGLIGWCVDPYDPEIRTGFLRNLSEDESYDGMFPQHPLSRSRKVLRLLEEHTRIADEVKLAAPFTGPGIS